MVLVGALAALNRAVREAEDILCRSARQVAEQRVRARPLGKGDRSHVAEADTRREGARIEAEHRARRKGDAGAPEVLCVLRVRLRIGAHLLAVARPADDPGDVVPERAVLAAL